MSRNRNMNFHSADFITEKDAIKIFKSCKDLHKHATFKSYSLRKASDRMLGFLSDYLKLEIQFIDEKNQIQSQYFFIKCVSKSNAAKARMVKEMKLFNKELTFYITIKDKINLRDLPAWSANIVTTLNDAMVFEDLNFLQYKLRNKFETFDEEHTLLALQTLARFHAGSIIYEEKKSRQFNKRYIIYDEHKNDLDRGGYQISDPWFKQCMHGALETIKSFSKYRSNKQAIRDIESRWLDIWTTALKFSDFSSDYRNVVSHRDLWNNNILFRYKEVENALVPVNCVLVDFQAVTFQPPAGDVMLLLCCNLDPHFRKDNINTFLDYYFHELECILCSNDIKITDVISHAEFLNTCEIYKLWGLVVSACLIPQFWLNDDLITKYFCDTVSFEEILTKDKPSFIKKMAEVNDGYKEKVIQVFEEIVETYCVELKAE